MQRTIRFLAASRLIVPMGAVLAFTMVLGASALRLIPEIRGSNSGAGRGQTPPAAARTSGARFLAANSATGPRVRTDHLDYYPGQNVVITGFGWQVGEVVSLVIHEDPTLDPDLTLYATADDMGAIFNNEFYTDWHDIGITFTLTATGANSGLTAQTTFTDSSANLDQCTNGGVGDPPEPCKTLSASGNWVNGNSNGQKSHWREGEFIAYRDTIAVDASGTHVFQIHYDTIHSGTHSIDYLGSFDATETTSPISTTFHANNSDPCTDKITGCNPSAPNDSFPVPAATLVNCGGSAGTFSGSQVPGAFKIWGNNSPDITNVAYVSENVVSGTGQCSTSVAITFTTAGSGPVVLAWGGHIASEADWGAGNSATFISGSPYHMAQDSLTSNGVLQSGVGAQDRALSASAVVFTPTIATQVKDSQGNDVTNTTI